MLPTVSVLAQPVINQSNLTLGVQTEVFIGETPSETFDPGTGGANKTWDFSNISLIPVGTSMTVTPFGRHRRIFLRRPIFAARDRAAAKPLLTAITK